MTERKTNALAGESSPYLLQHAHNPVDWMPWGEAAFEKARNEDKLVFLSIGYATCHWCHVMERESFESERIAEILNRDFVAIKVDREERPDIDAVYMAVTQALNDGQGGWPMSVWLTPDKQPVTAGTYFPPEDRFGRAGFASVLNKLAELWRGERERLSEQGEQITDWLRRQGAPEGKAELSAETLKANIEHHRMRFDARYGGFDGAPKFPTPHRVNTLLHWAAETGDKEALGMAEATLDNMARGGIHDHVGGGFHRYSTDREWLTPHFEKMLYDNALLMQAYLDAWQLTDKEIYRETIDDIAAYVLRDLRDKDGGFHSAEDADSEGEEGKFYVWTWDELGELLGAARDDTGVAARDLAAFVWGCTKAGNYREESTGELLGANILHLPRSLAESAKARDLSEAELRERVARWRETLFKARVKRERPLLDDKVLTDWNGLMIGALARAGAALDRPEYVRAAGQAADFILGRMVEDGRLLHRYRDGNAGIKAFAADYAYLINGLIDLYQADFDADRLAHADRLAGEMIRLFFHEEEGLLHLAGSDQDDAMIAPHREIYDGATPSANSAAALALVRLGRLLRKDEYVKTAERILSAMSSRLVAMPAAHGYGLLALEWLVWPTREVVLAGEREALGPMLSELRARLAPRTLVVWNDPAGAAAKLIPAIQDQGPVEGKAAAYVCENYTCQKPVTDAAALGEILTAKDEESRA